MANEGCTHAARSGLNAEKVIEQSCNEILVQEFAVPGLDDKQVDRHLWQGVVSKHDQVGDLVKPVQGPLLVLKRLLCDCADAYALLELEDQTCSDVLKDARCAGLLQLFNVVKEDVLFLVYVRHCTTSGSVWFGSKKSFLRD